MDGYTNGQELTDAYFFMDSGSGRLLLDIGNTGADRNMDSIAIAEPKQSGIPICPGCGQPIKGAIKMRIKSISLPHLDDKPVHKRCFKRV